MTIFKNRKDREAEKLNNEGASIVLVLVAMAFVGMLAVILVFMAYYNFLMKSTDRQAKENFYTAETALNEIRAGLQQDISTALAEAYVYTLQNNPEVELNYRDYIFREKYEYYLESILQNSAPIGRYDKSKLEGYLVLTADGTDFYTAESSENILENIGDGLLTLKNIKIRYTDPRGYVSVIETDIQMETPNISFMLNTGVPALENCSLIANESLVISQNTGNILRISGSVYGGKKGTVANNARVELAKKSTDSDYIMHRLIADSVNVNTGSANVDLSSNYELWTGDINVISADFATHGVAYVQDDLTVEGRDSAVTLEGTYSGYGDESNAAKNSSAILINGANTSLDMSNLNILTLAGHAYVGTTRYDAQYSKDTVKDSDYVENEDLQNYKDKLQQDKENNIERRYPQNTSDIVMGQSIGVKSDQLMYLVPKECMGYEGTTQVLAKNPISKSEYDMLTTTMVGEGENARRRYQEVRLDVIYDKIGKKPSDYGASWSPVFRRVDGSVLVYYYLAFPSEVTANQFFKDYYDNNKEGMESYIKSYINVDEFKWNISLGEEDSDTRLQLAGHMLYFDRDGHIVLRESTSIKDNENIDFLIEERRELSNKYLGLSKKLITDATTLSSEQLLNDIYQNLIVDDATFTGIVGSDFKVFEAGTVKALAVNNAGGSEYLVNYATPEYAIIIASGDVRVSANFTGLIIAGGNITITTECQRIDYDAASVKKAFGAVDAADTYKFADLLLDGSAYLAYESGDGGAGSEDEENETKKQDYIKTADLIHYANWKKK